MAFFVATGAAARCACATLLRARPTCRARCRGSRLAARRPARSRLPARRAGGRARRRARCSARPTLPGGDRGARRAACGAADADLERGSRAALADDLPLLKRDGGFVRAGFEPALDELRALARREPPRHRRPAGRLRRKTGCTQLRVKHNNLIGYYIEVPQAVGEELLKPPFNETFIHRQTMAGRDALLDDGAGRARVEDRLRLRSRRWRSNSACSTISAPELSRDRAEIRRRPTRWRSSTSPRRSPNSPRAATGCGPSVDDGLAFAIGGGRHPVVEAALRSATARRSSPTTATSPASGKAGRIAAHHRPQHGR